MSAFQEELLFRRLPKTSGMDYILEFDGKHYTACYAAGGNPEKYDVIYLGTFETPTTYMDHRRRWCLEGKLNLPRMIAGGQLDIDTEDGNALLFVTHGDERSAGYDTVFSPTERDGEIVFGACRGRDVFVVRKLCVAAAAT